MYLLKTRNLIIFLFLIALTILQPMGVKAQAPFPTAAPPIGYGKETNSDWFEICTSGDYQPLETGFFPTEYPSWVLVYPPNSDGMFRQPSLEWFGQSFPEMPPAPYVEDSLTYSYPEDQSQMCIWDMAITDGYNDEGYTPYKTFSNYIEFGDVSFSYDCSSATTWVPYFLEVVWDDVTTTDVSGDVCFGSGEGYVSETILPRDGHNISSVRVVFTEIDFPYHIPQPVVSIDNILIRGFYQLNPPTATPTGTPTATRTPTTTRTPTVTATPRPIWDTPTATPTGVFTPTATPTGVPTKLFDWVFAMPTKIPAVSLPAWPTPPTAQPWPGTPSALLSLPLIPTPLPVSPTVTLAPITYPTAALFAPTATITPTEVATTTPGTDCYAANFTGAELPAGWEIITGTFVAGSGIQYEAAGGNRTVALRNTGAGNYKSIAFYSSNTSGPYTRYFPTIDHYDGAGAAFMGFMLTYPTYQYFDSYEFRAEVTGITGDSFITSAPYCFYVDVPNTPTITPTPTPTRNDLVAVLDVMASNLQAEVDVMKTPATFEIMTPPPEYAPSLPRNMAAVGWTFEHMDTSAGLGFGFNSWASLLGYIASLPFQIIKMIYNIFNLMGPVRLYILWLLALLPYTLWMKLMLLIKNLITSIINIIFKIIQLVGDIWDMIPGL